MIDFLLDGCLLLDNNYIIKLHDRKNSGVVFNSTAKVFSERGIVN